MILFDKQAENRYLIAGFRMLFISLEVNSELLLDALQFINNFHKFLFKLGFMCSNHDEHHLQDFTTLDASGMNQNVYNHIVYIFKKNCLCCVVMTFETFSFCWIFLFFFVVFSVKHTML